MGDISNLVPFLTYYLTENSTINALVGGKIEPQDDDLVTDDLIAEKNNTTQTCILLEEITSNRKPTVGCNIHGRIEYDISIEIEVRGLRSKAYIRKVADEVEHLLIGGIPATEYDGVDYWLLTTVISPRDIKDPDDPVRRRILTLRGRGFYAK